MSYGGNTYGGNSYGGGSPSGGGWLPTPVVNLIISFNRVIYLIRSTVKVLSPRNK